tara:strand:- start:26 stop:424 length:399 start_codon:yes stop_codon:yes gene_type:complete
MGKNIAIIILLGLIGFFGYYLFNTQTIPPEGEQALVQRVKQKVSVVIYSSNSCRYCLLAKDFMDKKGIQFDVRDVNIGKNAREMSERTNGSRGIPQIFINHKHIGGWSELNMLEQKGFLDLMLAGQTVDLNK